jgi:tetratricopeptide (TPR) repeat protein
MWTLAIWTLCPAWGTHAQVASTLQQDPPPVVVEATERVARAVRAVEADSAASLRSAWEREREEDPDLVGPILGLAALDRLTYRIEEAEAAYRALLDGDDELVRIESRLAALGLGLTLAGSFRVAEADELLRRVADAARIHGEATVEAEALVVLASLRARSHGTAVALALLDRADSILPSDPLLHAQVRCQRGLVLVRTGDPRALVLASEGIELARAAGSKRVEASCVTVRAQDDERAGRTSDAFRNLREVAALQRETGNLSGLAATLQWNAFLRSTYGQFGAAIRQLNEALGHAAASRNRSVEAWASMNLADISLRLDDPVAARAHARRAEALLRELGDLWGLAFLRGVQGDAANLAGDLEAAETAYEEALELTRAGNPALGVTLVQKLASVARRGGELDLAEGLLEEAARWADELRMPGYSLYDHTYALGLLALDRGAFSEAEARFRGFLDRVPVTRNTHEFRFDAQARLAEARVGQGDIAGAGAELAAALGELDGYRAVLGARQFRLSVLHARKFDWDRDLGIAGIIASVAAGGRVDEALALSEAQRSRVLLDRVARRSSLEDASDDGSDERVPGPRDGGPQPADTTAGGAREAMVVTGRDRIQATLSPTEAVVSFVVDRGGGPTTAFVVTASTLVAVPLPPLDSLADDIDRFVRLLSGGAGAAILARSLGDLLLAPAVELLPPSVDRLILVPDGALHRLPFDALLLSDGRRVVERFVTSLAPSVSFVAAHPDDDRRPAGTSTELLAFGDPTLGEHRDGGGPEWASLVPSDLPGLPGSRQEVRAVARYGRPGRVLTGAAASEATLKGRSGGAAAVLHFATHAVVSERSLLRTALLLAPGEGEDGLVYPGEVAALELDADLVVLSACETADGTVLAAEGMQGLAAPFLEAGARAVVASYWPLGDEAAVTMIDDLYREMARGSTVTDALRTAKLNAMERGAPPDQWASLTVLGDGRVRPALRAPRPWMAPTGWGLGAVAAAVLIYGTVARMRKRRGLAETS